MVGGLLQGVQQQQAFHNCEGMSTENTYCYSEVGYTGLILMQLFSCQVKGIKLWQQVFTLKVSAALDKVALES
jgi:hypothetical protein